MKKTLKQILLGVVCIMALTTIASCDKDGNESGNGTPGGGGNTPAGYVDLNLPTGTLWKTTNETNPNDENGLYTYDEAMAAFGNKLPTKGQYEELRHSCIWTWTGSGYEIVGQNNNYITLPVTWSNNDFYGGDLYGGDYWLSSPKDSDSAWCFHFDCYEDGHGGSTGYSDAIVSNRSERKTVRLVQY